MGEDYFEGLSAAQREQAHAALTGAFGRAPIDGVAPVAGGASTASTFSRNHPARCGSCAATGCR